MGVYLTCMRFGRGPVDHGTVFMMRVVEKVRCRNDAGMMLLFGSVEDGMWWDGVEWHNEILGQVRYRLPMRKERKGGSFVREGEVTGAEHRRGSAVDLSSYLDIEETLSPVIGPSIWGDFLG